LELIQQIINGLLLGCNYTLIAIGFSLFFGALNVVHFSHGDVCILGSSAALTGIMGAVFEKLTIKPFRQAPLLMVLVATVALGLIIRESLRIFFFL